MNRSDIRRSVSERDRSGTKQDSSGASTFFGRGFDPGCGPTSWITRAFSSRASGTTPHAASSLGGRRHLHRRPEEADEFARHGNGRDRRRPPRGDAMEERIEPVLRFPRVREERG